MLAYLVPVCKLEPDMPRISALTHPQGMTCRTICCSPDIFLYSKNSLHLRRLNCILKNTQQPANKKWMLHLQGALPLPLSWARAHAFPLETGEVSFWTWPGLRARVGPQWHYGIHPHGDRSSMDQKVLQGAKLEGNWNQDPLTLEFIVE